MTDAYTHERLQICTANDREQPLVAALPAADSSGSRRI